ncbi:hypothetical protein TrST_g7697 [Triparma strigata]|uniref:Ketoreductase domain-containing protein n=1 Tax=Triparma strigata TaxID=1606541 RepID=A0A9W7A7A5_9STRA|nr:hypothetical protein TrST_g7697 [Triparma strigata]
MLKKVAVAVGAVAFAMLDANPSLWIYDKLAPSNAFYENKNIWITGASSGIGAELAVQLSEAGANVVISARREKELEEVKGRCKAGSSVKVVPLDVTDRKAMHKSVEDVVEGHFGKKGLDILILNAGKSQRLPAMKTDLQMTRDLMNLNFESLVDMTLKVMKTDKWVERETGHIVVTSSVAGKLPVALSSSYAATKAAVNGYFSSLRSEFSWLRVDIVCPGPIATPIARNAASSAEGAKLLQNESEDNKMPVDRFTKLMLSGVKGPKQLFYETWISYQPVLFFTGAAQYVPTLAINLSKVVGPKRIKAFEAGKDVYKMSSWVTRDDVEK